MFAPLITVRLSKVPKYLRNSELYLSFDREADDLISVPNDCFKSDLQVKSAQDLNHLLRTMRFWVLTTFPDCFIEYLLNKLGCNGHVLRKYEKEFPELREFLKAVHGLPKGNASSIAVLFNRVDFLDYFARHSRFGDVCDESTFQDAVESANFETLKYAHQKFFRGKSLQCVNSFRFIVKGNVAAMKYLVEHGLPVDVEMCEKAAHVGSLPVLKYLYNHFPQSSPHINFIGLTAAQYDQIECLEYAVERGCDVNTELCRAAIAATAGNKCLQYLISSHPEVMLTEQMFAHVCRTDNLPALQMLHQHGCSMHPIAAEAAAAGGSMQCLQFLNDLGFDCWQPSTMAAAARADQIDLVCQLYGQCCAWDDTAIWAAERAASTECFHFLTAQCCPAEGKCKRPADKVCFDCYFYNFRNSSDKLPFNSAVEDFQTSLSGLKSNHDKLAARQERIAAKLDEMEKATEQLMKRLDRQERAIDQLMKGVDRQKRSNDQLMKRVIRQERLILSFDSM